MCSKMLSALSGRTECQGCTCLGLVGWAPRESQQWLATTYQTQPFTSLRSLQIQAGTGKPRKDRCLVNVLRFLPAEVQDLCHTRAQLGLPYTGAAVPLMRACELLPDSALMVTA